MEDAFQIYGVSKMKNIALFHNNSLTWISRPSFRSSICHHELTVEQARVESWMRLSP